MDTILGSMQFVCNYFLLLFSVALLPVLITSFPLPGHQPIPEGEEMHREARGRSSSSDENAELNTEQRPLVTANRSSAPPQVDNSKGVARPSPDDTTPLLNSASPRRDYHSVPPRGTINGLERSLQHAPPRVLEEEEEDQLTATLPASLGHSSSQVETRPAQREQRVSPLTDTGDDDETFQAKLLAVRKEARHRRRLRKTISGALDITEDVTVALLGNPNLAEACHHSPAASRTDTPTPSDSPPPTQGVFLLICVSSTSYCGHMQLILVCGFAQLSLNHRVSMLFTSCNIGVSSLLPMLYCSPLFSIFFSPFPSPPPPLLPLPLPLPSPSSPSSFPSPSSSG